MFVPFHDGVISQFEGYERLAELDWDGYRERYGDIQRLDRILEAEGDDVNRYRASKQADVLMLFYLLSADELRDLLERLGYRFEPDAIPRTIDYYLAPDLPRFDAQRGGALLGAGARQSRRGRGVLRAECSSPTSPTSREARPRRASTWQPWRGASTCFSAASPGLETRGDRLIFSPQWPETLGALEFPIVYRGHQLWLTHQRSPRSGQCGRRKSTRDRESRVVTRWSDWNRGARSAVLVLYATVGAPPRPAPPAVSRPAIRVCGRDRSIL